jgi:transcriptional regulator with XRE-family HTH domain
MKPDPREELRSIGPWIKAMRERRGWTLQDVARRSGLSKPYIAQLERQEANPTEATLWKIATAFEVTLADLLGAALAEGRSDDSPSFQEFVERYRPEPDLLPALRELQFRGRAPKTASEWRRLYEVIRTLTTEEGEGQG